VIDQLVAMLHSGQHCWQRSVWCLALPYLLTWSPSCPCLMLVPPPSAIRPLGVLLDNVVNGWTYNFITSSHVGTTATLSGGTALERVRPFQHTGSHLLT